MKRALFIPFILFLLTNCKKEKDEVFYDDVRTIEITKGVNIDNGAYIHDPIFNQRNYESFLNYLVSSDRFLIVPQKDFNQTSSSDKIVLTLRHDIDDNINSAVKFAYREHKYGVKATYFVLHTAHYYGVTKENYFRRNDNVIYFLKKIQNGFGHEIGWHNDLVTLQIVYNIEPKEYLKNELAWLRANGINIYGTTSHGSEYCYKYHYVNAYFWDDVTGSHSGNFYNWETVPKDGELIAIEKDKLSNYDLLYDGNDFHPDYFFADCDFLKGKRWNMNMVNWDTIKPGKKIILLLHSQHWD